MLNHKINHYLLKNIIPFFTVISLLFLSCAKNQQKKSEKSKIAVPKDENIKITRLKEKIMATHDSAMVKIDSILVLKIAVKKKLEDNESLKNLNINILQKKYNDLELANKGMFSWMADYEPNKEFENDSLKYLYFEVQLEQITKVHDNIFEAIKIKP